MSMEQNLALGVDKTLLIRSFMVDKDAVGVALGPG